jgi:[protein-PII] uridylyltransferase
MANILRQRDIIDRRALAEALAQAIGDVPASAIDRSVLLPPLKAALARGRAEIRRRFDADGTAIRPAGEQCFLIDQLIRALYDLATETIYPLANPTAGEKMAIVAVGGYGRGEMAPFSDVDLLFLLPYKQTPHTEQVIEFLLYLLWDLGLKVGQATRTVADCMRYAKADLTIRTALIEARYVWGEQALYT